MKLIDKFNKILRRREQLHGDYTATFNSPEGQRVLADICRMGYISNSTFSPLNPHKTILNEGGRLLALAILKKLHKQPVEAATEAIIEG